MRLIVFDVDGTLVDSQHEIVAAQASAFAAVGLPAPTRRTALSVVGLSLHEAFAVLAGPDGPIDELAAAYKAAWTRIRSEPGYRDPLYPGAAALIDALSATSGIRLGIATGKSVRGVDRILAAQGWTETFATVQTADTHPSKPDPAMLLAALDATGCAARDAVMIGDTTYDIEMAVAAGVRAIGVAWGYHEVDALQAAGAEMVAESYDRLRTILGVARREAA